MKFLKNMTNRIQEAADEPVTLHTIGACNIDTVVLTITKIVPINIFLYFAPTNVYQGRGYFYAKNGTKVGFSGTSFEEFTLQNIQPDVFDLVFQGETVKYSSFSKHETSENTLVKFQLVQNEF